VVSEDPTRFDNVAGRSVSAFQIQSDERLDYIGDRIRRARCGFLGLRLLRGRIGAGPDLKLRPSRFLASIGKA
jgi:hypothetical protein